MLSCDQATRLMSESQERPLRASERAWLRVHLLICDGCRRFQRQVGVLRNAMRAFARWDAGEGAEDAAGPR
jgi:hypothetical protein